MAYPQGKLLQLALPGAGLNCGGQGLPPAFSKLTELQILDVAYNEIGGTTEALGDLIGKVSPFLLVQSSVYSYHDTCLLFSFPNCVEPTFATPT